jgi:exoribonuclease-2
MFSRGLEPEFDIAVHKQLAHIEGPAREDDAQIKDLTHLPWCSIDNDDSRDLDQLTAIKEIGFSQMQVYVAIADVDALVMKCSAIDAHARHNTTSVYTSARIFPMLPERLCTDLTSLNQDQDRLALVIEMAFSEDAVLESYKLYRAMVRNKAKLAYDAVSDWIENHAGLPEPARRVTGMDLQLRWQDGLAQKLKVLRKAQGSLEFETFQPRALFAGERIVDIRQQPQNRARQLIEELMIATNGSTARFLAAHGCASLRRVVRSPERWQRIVDVANGYGSRCRSNQTDRHLKPFWPVSTRPIR